MLSNHVYDLAEQLTIENKSLWRLQKTYPNDAGDCQECAELWEKLARQKEENITRIRRLLHDHLEEEPLRL